MIKKTYSQYYLDNYLINYDYNKKEYLVLTFNLCSNLKQKFLDYFGTNTFTAKTKQELLNNLNNFNQYYLLEFNPEFKHIKTRYYEPENKLPIYRESKGWLIIKNGNVYLEKTRKKAVNKYISDNNKIK